MVVGKSIGIIVFSALKMLRSEVVLSQRAVQRAVCPSRFLKLMSQVTAEWLCAGETLVRRVTGFGKEV
jgi:hypothetical protein